jgi:tape measure domain-containing protein
MVERIEAWLRVRDGQRYSRDMRDAAKATASLGAAGAAAGRNAMWAGQQGHRARQGFMAMGTGARWAAFGLGIAGAGAVKMGIDFNSTMEQQEIALDQFLGSGVKTQRMLNTLFEIAAKTPFEFRDVTTAARKFLAFGFTAQETTKYLRTVGDAVAGIGGGVDEIGRAVLALGQMQAKGRIMGQELLQLTELGIPAYRILREEFNLTNKEMNRIGDQGISAKKGIAALIRGMDETFGGAAKRQAKSFAGQWSTFKDYFRQTMGALTRPIFDILRKTIMPGLIKLMPVVQKEAPKIMKGFWAGITGGLAPGGKNARIASNIGQWIAGAFAVVKGAVKEFITAIKPAMPFINNVVLPLLKGLAIGVGITLVGLFKLGIFVIGVLAKVLGWLGEKAEPIKPVFEGIGIVIGLLFAGPILKALTFIPKLGAVFGLLGRGIIWVGKVIGAVFGAMFSVFGKMFGWLGKIIGFFGFFIGKWIKYHVIAWRTVFQAFGKIVRFLTGIIGKIIGVAVKIGRGIVTGIGKGLSFLIGLLRGVMNRALGFVAGLGQRFFNTGVKIAKAMINGIKSLFGAGMGFALDVGKSIANAVIGLLNRAIPNKLPVPFGPDINIPDDPIPKLWSGGRSTGMLASVGEHGRETMWVPAGAEVYPNGSRATRRGLRGFGGGSSLGSPVVEPLGGGELVGSMMYPATGGGGADRRVVQLVVGRRVLAEAFMDELETQRARQ